jgi:hypothetical protein
MDIDHRTHYERILISLHSQLDAVTTATGRNHILGEIDKLKVWYFNLVTSEAKRAHMESSPPAPQPIAVRRPKPREMKGARRPDGAVIDLLAPDIRHDETKFDREMREYRQHNQLAREMGTNPFKTNDRQDDLRFQTHGTPNRRGKEFF